MSQENRPPTGVERRPAQKKRKQLTIGPYQVVSRLGRGGMGTVYKAFDPALLRHAAIKVLSSELSDNEEYIQRFFREARLAAQLDHPGITPVYSAGRDRGMCYIAMQFVEGSLLSTLIREKGRFTERRALEVCRKIAVALGAAHARGLIHRDIKPENVMVEPGGEIKILDFGLARRTRTPSKITDHNVYLGTPEYSSPEQCESDDLDPRTDLYSLGVLFYEMLTGRVPFTAETPYQLFKRIVEERPRPAREFNPFVSPDTERLLNDLLAKNREHRLPSAEEVVRRLDEILAQRVPEELARRPRARPWPLVAGLAGVGLALSLLLFLLFATGGRGARLAAGDTVLVLNFGVPAETEASWLGLALPEMMQRALVRGGELLIPLSRAGLPRAGRGLGHSEVLRLANQRGAALVCEGVVRLAEGGRLRVAVALRHVASRQELLRVEESADWESGLFELANRLAARLLGEARRRMGSAAVAQPAAVFDSEGDFFAAPRGGAETPEQAAQRVRGRIGALRDYYSALDLMSRPPLDAADRERAIRLLERVLGVEPGFSEASQVLETLRPAAPR